MSNFAAFSLGIAARFTQLSKHELFVVNMTGQEVWDEYLKSFPPGTNPVYRERTEHDCSCCKQFVRNIGNVVAIIDGKAVSVWSLNTAKLDHPYNIVAETLARKVESAGIWGVFRSKEGVFGSVFTMENGVEPKRWNHFHAHLDQRHVAQNADALRGQYNENAAMMKRALTEIDPVAVSDTLALIDDNLLYRGAEFLPWVHKFCIAQAKYKALRPEDRDNYIWANCGDMAVSRFRNTMIGTLITDLSNGMSTEMAVKAFEEKAAPQNYKRPSALITQSMVKAAEDTAAKLGLLDTLQRRFAKLSDVSVQDVLWVDGSKRDLMRATSPFSSIMKTTAGSRKPKLTAPQADAMSIDEFMQEVLPKTTELEMLVKNTHQHNFVSLTAPMEFTEHRLFKWGNPFAWSYVGNVTDSIKERVKRAGGNTGAPLRVSLAWFNKDDLDLHSASPHGHVYFGNKMGILDVDMNAGMGTTSEPVENQSWDAPKDGTYKIVVNQYNQRETLNPGFTLEMECNGGQLMQWNWAKPVKGQNEVLQFVVRKGRVEQIKTLAALQLGSTSRERWGIATENYVKVNTVMLSPNHWGSESIGNKHHLFILDGCVNDEPTRGIYNEFLNPELEKHRKVFEVLGSKTLCPPSTDQLSGVGFSSTRGDKITVRADKRVYEINF